jgi:hypothetical protein
MSAASVWATSWEFREFGGWKPIQPEIQVFLEAKYKEGKHQSLAVIINATERYLYNFDEQAQHRQWKEESCGEWVNVKRRFIRRIAVDPQYASYPSLEQQNPSLEQQNPSF